MPPWVEGASLRWAVGCLSTAEWRCIYYFWLWWQRYSMIETCFGWLSFFSLVFLRLFLIVCCRSETLTIYTYRNSSFGDEWWQQLIDLDAALLPEVLSSRVSVLGSNSVILQSWLKKFLLSFIIIGISPIVSSYSVACVFYRWPSSLWKCGSMVDISTYLNEISLCFIYSLCFFFGLFFYEYHRWSY